MPTIIDNIEIDDNNQEFNFASDFVNHTNKMVYLTGKAGTGKTTFLKYIRETMKKNMVVLAPTGVAAINAGGQTIHSFFQIRPSIYVPGDARLRTVAPFGDSDKSVVFDHFKYHKEKLKIIRSLQLLVIDEISMVRCDLLDVVDSLLRIFRKRPNDAFGGVQVVLIGDTFQLPPIAKNDDWDILSAHYKSPFFFSAKVVQQNKPVYIELKKIYRQKERKFIDILNKVRVNQIDDHDIVELNNKYRPDFTPPEQDKYITLATHNKIVDATNMTKLAEIDSENHTFEAIISGTFPENITSTPKILQLKEGAQVMFTRNDRGKRYYNGKIGILKTIKGTTITVEINDISGEPEELKIERDTWENIRYKWNEETNKIEEEVIGTFVQYPLKLAWAITIHKSQGLTFEKVIADLGAAFAPGQVYVALSRCTSLNGLVLKTSIGRQTIKTDRDVLNFAQNETPETLIVQELNTVKADKFYSQAVKNFKKGNIEDALDCLLKAITYRNDMDTKAFKRYLIILFKRYGSTNKTAGKLAELQKRNSALLKKLKVTETNYAAKKAEREQQNKAIKILLDKTDTYHNENKRLIAEAQNFKDKYKYIKKEIGKKNKEIERQKREIIKLEKLLADSR